VFYVSIFLDGLHNFDEVLAILVLIWVIRKAYVTATAPDQGGHFIQCQGGLYLIQLNETLSNINTRE
jgi:hypothetical protein